MRTRVTDASRITVDRGVPEPNFPAKYRDTKAVYTKRNPDADSQIHEIYTALPGVTFKESDRQITYTVPAEVNKNELEAPVAAAMRNREAAKAPRQNLNSSHADHEVEMSSEDILRLAGA
jgi:hypothetical protein